MSICLGAAAQNTDSPYSSFGYGLLRDNATSMQRQMGGIGYAMFGGRQINVMNPASYCRIDSLTFLFDMGAEVSMINSKEESASHTQAGGGLSYITMQFPISKKIGMSIGLLPYTSVGYAFGSKIDNGSMQRSGSGGFNQIYAGIGATPFKGFSIGANFSYLFGTVTNDIYGLTTSSTAVFEQTMSVRDWEMVLGAQYQVNLSRTEVLGFGVVFSPGKELLGDAQVVKYAYGAGSSSYKPDTVEQLKMKNNFSLASTIGAGVSYRKGNRWMVEADVTYQPWSKAKYTQMSGFPATRFLNRYKLSVGGQYKPKDRGTYFESVTYRFGASANRDYMMVGDNQVREWTVSCGVGLPTMSTKTIINVGLEYKLRHTHPTSLLRENYFSLTVGVNFNELWFFKRKID